MDAIRNLTPEQRLVLALFMHDNDTLADPERDFACALTALESLAYNAEHIPQPSAQIYLARLDAARATLEALLALPSTANTDAPTVDWLWWGSDANDVEHISFGRWQSHACQHRYKLAAVQPTEHDHPQPLPSIAKGGDAVFPNRVAEGVVRYADSVFVWFDEAEMVGGAAVTMEDAVRQRNAYAASLTPSETSAASAERAFASSGDDAVRTALTETQSLLAAMLHETRPREEIEKQIAANRDVLGPDC